VILLAFDTTSEHGSIALMNGGAILEEVALHSPEGFGHILFIEIEALLKRHKRAIGDVDAFASASGPGSFTGVRIGLTALKALAEATGRSAVSISNLQALAWHGTAEFRAVVIDARRGEIYGAVYNQNLEPVIPEAVLPLESWLPQIRAFGNQDDIEYVVQPASTKEQVSDALTRGGAASRRIREAPLALASAIANVAFREIQAGRTQDPSEIDANYVRRSDAELLWRDPAARL
jgi:tRNA threonylcarbamoyladenosine biosynthesis protein TsaB